MNGFSIRPLFYLFMQQPLSPLSECIICNNNTVDTTIIQCQYCSGAACAACWETYFITDNPTILQPRCMFPTCRREFIAEYLHQNHFLTNALRDRQSEVLFNIDRTYYPLAQHVIQLIETQNRVANAAEHMVYDRLIHDAIMGNTATRLQTPYYHKCPTDNCLGHLDSAHYCTLCKNTICPDCNKATTTTTIHTCNETDRQTFAAIRNDAKECPKCGIYISKIDGCNDMFCIQCNTPFKYDTGLINTDRNSNPLYLNYLRRNGTDLPPGGMAAVPQCGNGNGNIRVNGFFVVDFANKLQSKVTIYMMAAQSPSIFDLINGFVRFTLHLATENREENQHYDSRTFWTQYARVNSTRVDYLQGKHTKAAHKTALYKLYKTNEYVAAVAQITDMYIQCAHDILIELYQYTLLQSTTWPDIKAWGLIDKMQKLADYTNQSFAANEKIYCGHRNGHKQCKTHVVLYNPTPKYDMRTNTSVMELVFHPALLNNAAYNSYNTRMQEYHKDQSKNTNKKIKA